MSPEFRRATRFPGSGETANPLRSGRVNNVNRSTRFPGGTELQKISIIEADESPNTNKDQERALYQLPSRLPLKINQPDTPPTKPLPVFKISPPPQEHDPPGIQMKSPWIKYTSLRTLKRGTEVVAACEKQEPFTMVSLKRLSLEYFEKYGGCRHENLLAIIEVYQHEGHLLGITEYTTATLKQVIAIPLPLEEIHISAIFLAMQYLSTFGIAHVKLDSSKVLFQSDGCVKITHFDECQVTESGSARSLGAIAVEMMQNGIMPENDKKLVIKHAERWSAEASNFVEIASWGTLKDIEKNRFLKYVPPTIMIPFVEYSRWDTIESLSMIET